MLWKIGAAAFAALALAGPAAAAAGGCHDVSGTFVAVAPAVCPSPVGICTHGTLSGDLAGTYDFVASGFSPTGDLVGNSTITLKNGAVIYGNDTSVLGPGGSFVTS